MEILHATDPTCHLARFLIGAVDRVNVDGGGTRHIFALHVLELQDRLVFRVETGLVEHRDAKILLLTVGFRHFKEGVDLADRGDVVRDERLNLCVKFNLLRLVPLYVFKHFFEFR